MTIRRATIEKGISDAIESIKKDLALEVNANSTKLRGVNSALKKLEKLEDKINGKKAPPRPPNAFAQFFKENRSAAKAANPNATPPELMKMLSEEYRKKKSTAA